MHILGSGSPIADDDRASSGYPIWVDGDSMPHRASFVKLPSARRKARVEPFHGRSLRYVVLFNILASGVVQDHVTCGFTRQRDQHRERNFAFV